MSSEIEIKSGKENKLLCEKVIILNNWKKFDISLNLIELKGIKKVWLKIYVLILIMNFYIDFFIFKVFDNFYFIKFESFEDKSIVGFIF